MKENPSRLPEKTDHFSYVTRRLIHLYKQGALTNVTGLDVEPNYGHVSRITYFDGSHRVTYGNDLGLNTGASGELARDKGHTKFMLRAIGVEHPRGDEFLLPWWAEKIGPSQAQRGNTELKTTDRIDSYLQDDLGYPAYMKPVDGSKGAGVFKVHAPEDLGEIIDQYTDAKVRVAIVEEPINMPDYRVVVLDGQLVSAYRRDPLAVTGDGVKNVRDLLGAVQEKYIADGRDTRIDPNDSRIIKQLKQGGLTLDSIPPQGRSLPLVPVSNLSTGGTSVDVTSTIASKWTEMSAYVADNFGLRLCGVDLACEDITDPESSYSVLEVNSAPGLDHYASSGKEQEELVDRLYTRVFNALPNTPRANI